MVGVGDDGCREGILEGADRENWGTSSAGVNQLTYNLVRVQGDGAFIPGLEDEVMEVEHLLAEPPTDKDLNDGVTYMNLENTRKFVAVEDIPCAVGYYDSKTDFGIQDMASASTGKPETKYEFADSMLRGVDEEEDLHVPCNLSSSCPDFQFENSQMDCTSRNTSCLGNLASECETQSIERNNDAGEMSDLSNAINPSPETTFDQRTLLSNNTSTNELHDAFSTFGWDTCIKGEQWLKHRIWFGLKSFAEIDNASGLSNYGLSSNENEDEMIWMPNNLSDGVHNPFINISDSSSLVVDRGMGKDGHSSEAVPSINFSQVGKVGFGFLHCQKSENTLTTSKRLRKPTRRYIEESSEMKSRCCNGRMKRPVTGFRDKLSHGRAGNDYQPEVLRVGQLVCQESPSWSCIQISNGLQVQRGRPRKNATLEGDETIVCKEHMLLSAASETNNTLTLSDSESESGIPDDSSTDSRNVIKGTRRKHHRLWTLSEVMKLIEGVTQYGVGRWTDIKRLLFSASSHRTSVDLKDKWRNLLRASGAKMRNRNQVKPQQHMYLPIPQSVLRRVRELAVIHPYPRERKPRPPSDPVTSSSTGGNEMTIRRSGRAAHKRSMCEDM